MRAWIDLLAPGSGLLIAASITACDTQAGERSRASDASTTGASGATTSDAATGDGGVSASGALRSALVGVLTEFDRQAEARCRCLVKDGDFDSLAQCLDKTGGELRFADRFSKVLAPMDGDELRAELQCAADDFAQRGACLDAAACTNDEIVPCLQMELGCPMSDPQTLTRLLAECPGAAMLGR